MLRRQFATFTTNNVTNMFRYSDAIAKHIPKDVLKTFQKTPLYSKKKLN